MWNLLDNNTKWRCLVPGVMVPPCNPSTWAIDMNHSQLYSKFENSLGFMRPYQKKRDKERSEGREKNLFKYFYNSLLPESTCLPLIVDISQSTPTYLFTFCWTSLMLSNWCFQLDWLIFVTLFICELQWLLLGFSSRLSPCIFSVPQFLLWIWKLACGFVWQSNMLVSDY